MSESAWDVAVIGAGAAGLMAALCAAELGRRVLLLEKNRRPGVKILMSGGTPLQHHPRHRQPRHRRCLRPARALPPFRPRRFQRAGHPRLLRGRRRPDQGRGDRAKSSRSATGRPTCSTPCFAASAAAARPSPSASRSSIWSGASRVRPGDTDAQPISAAPRHPDDGRPVVPRQRHHRRRLSLRREVRPHHRPAAAGARAHHGERALGDGAARPHHSRHRRARPGRARDRWRRAAARCCSRTSDCPGRSSSTSAASSAATPGLSRLLWRSTFCRRSRKRTSTSSCAASRWPRARSSSRVVLSEQLPRRLCDALLAAAGMPVDRRAAALSKPDRAKLVQSVKRLRLPVQGDARLRQGGGDGGRRGAGRGGFALACGARKYTNCSSPARCSTWTAPSAATTFRRRGAPAGSRERKRRRSEQLRSAAHASAKHRYPDYFKPP